jgi:acyl dehydratase
MASLDTSDLDRWVGKSIGGGQLKEPIGANDIRRWVQGMQNPHPLHFDERYAKESRFGEIVAPQSFVVCTSDSHGAAPSIQGRIEGSHMLFGGDEWWFFGPRVRPGDRVRQERVFDGYDVKETKFAGPTVFARGDTTYLDQRGEAIAKQRSTSIRYLVEEAKKRRREGDAEKEPVWSDAELGEVEKKKFAYYRTFLDLGHEKRANVAAGERLFERIIGPHSLQTFATEWRAYLMSVWGAFESDGGATSLRQAGWLPEMDKDMNAAKIDPSFQDGMYKGSSRGHLDARYAQLIGMPRGYGYGASMGAWILDYLSNWAGEHGEVVHSKAQYRAPALTGDLTILKGEVSAVEGSTAHVAIEMVNQAGQVLASGAAEVRLW